MSGYTKEGTLHPLPIIFVHMGKHFYLENAVRLARFYNPDSQIFLLGDSSNKFLVKYGISHFSMDEYSEEAEEFRSYYVHMSSNYEKFELFCFQRWFIIQAFVRRHKIDRFICIDSDVLVYSNLTADFEDIPFTQLVVCAWLPVLINTDMLNSLTVFMKEMYQDQKIEQLKAIYGTLFNDKNQRIRMGGINDLILIRLWIEKEKIDTFDYNFPRNGKSLDGNIQVAYGFGMKDGRKEIIWKDNLPYGRFLGEGQDEWVRLMYLHFQGRSKMKQPYYLIDREGRHIEDLSFSVKCTIMKAWGMKIYSGLKKIGFMSQFFWNKFKVKHIKR